MWCCAILFMFFHVYMPIGSHTLPNMDQAVGGRDQAYWRLWLNLCLSSVKFCQAHPKTSAGERLSHPSYPYSPVPRKRILEPFLSSHLAALRKRCSWPQNNHSVGKRPVFLSMQLLRKHKPFNHAIFIALFLSPTVRIYDRTSLWKPKTLYTVVHLTYSIELLKFLTKFSGIF